jgi:hypothetical protein
VIDLIVNIKVHSILLHYVHDHILTMPAVFFILYLLLACWFVLLGWFQIHYIFIPFILTPLLKVFGVKGCGKPDTHSEHVKQNIEMEPNDRPTIDPVDNEDVEYDNDIDTEENTSNEDDGCEYPPPESTRQISVSFKKALMHRHSLHLCDE